MPIVLTDSTRDMVVTGVATVNGHLQFIAGGRRAATTARYDTWQYDSLASTEDVPWYLAWSYMDNGVELTAKTIRKMRPKGQFTDAAMQLYLTTPDTNVDVTDLETGANPTFEKVLTNSTSVRQYEVTKCRARNGMMWTARMEGVSPAGSPDQLHELIVEVDVFGQER